MRFAQLHKTHSFSYTIVTIVLVLETNAFKLPPHTATHVANSDFEAEISLKLPLTGTHLRKRAVATLAYSPESTLHPQVMYMYAIAFSAGLHQADKEINKRASPITPSNLWYTRSVSELWRHYTCHAYTINAWQRQPSMRSIHGESNRHF